MPAESYPELDVGKETGVPPTKLRAAARPIAVVGGIVDAEKAYFDNGLLAGKAIALAHAKPLLAINHLEGHALSPRLAEGGATFPYLLLLVSGGHCQFIAVLDVGVYRRFGSTIDDALGEAYDKLAKLLDLGCVAGQGFLFARSSPLKVVSGMPFAARRAELRRAQMSQDRLTATGRFNVGGDGRTRSVA